MVSQGLAPVTHGRPSDSLSRFCNAPAYPLVSLDPELCALPSGEPLRQGVRAHMAGFGKAIALGLGLLHDWRPQYRARQFQAEIK